jgi:peptidylprolyl isomerase
MHSGFAIAFVPKGAGLRKATVTILSNDPTASPFTFSIQGTGLKTTNSADGLQVATTVKGIGTAAISTTHITINYTGFLLNGTVFDTSYSPGKTPVQLTLNDPTIMQGWLEGLVGIKSGESRVLFVPAALSTGDPPHGAVPANATLIFTVNALIPVVVVSGNGVPIAFNDKTAIGADGTFIGATPAGSMAPLTFTFKISNGSAGKVGFPTLSLPVPSPVVVFTGKNAANFSASGLTFDSSFDFATFTVTYTPTKAGTQTAVAHVRTSDPVHPDFTFTVAGTSTPFLDLSPVVVGTINYPPATSSRARRPSTKSR